MYKIGIGYEVHKLKEGERLILGGLQIKSNFGIVGHSDGDVLIHSIIDSILGAASKGDLGSYFPSSDQKWKNYSSLKMLSIICSKIENHFIIQHIDSIIILQKPNISSYVNEMKEYIAKTINVDLASISVKATTTDHLGFIGKSKGIACQAIATLMQK